MLPARQRSHLSARIERVAQPYGFRQGHEALEKFIRDALVQQQSRPGNAGLALIVKNRPGRAIDGGGQIGVLENDIRALAAEFQLYLLQITC